VNTKRFRSISSWSVGDTSQSYVGSVFPVKLGQERGSTASTSRPFWIKSLVALSSKSA